jgi:hypothetical protein
LNRNTSGLTTSLSHRMSGGIALFALSVVAAGCAGEKPFARVNGQPITREEYTKALERQQVAVPGGQTVTAERLVLDQIIGQKIILAEASKASALPTDDEVTRVYELRKKLFEQQFPGKNFDSTLQEQGLSPEEIKSDIKMQLAETAVYAKKLKLGEDEVKKQWEDMKGQYGLPERVQLRLILTADKSPDFNEAKKMIDAKTDFNEVAKKINPAALKASGGLLPQTTPLTNINPQFVNKVKQNPEGYVFGPVDFPLQQGQPPAKAWVKIEKKFPAYMVSFEEAVPLVRQSVVQQKILMPENAKIRDEIMSLKMQASFEPSDTAYNKGAEDAGVGKMAATGPGAGAAVTPPAGAAGGGAPAPK